MKYDLTDPNQPKPISSTNYQYAGRHDHDPTRDDPSLKPEEGEDFRFLEVQFGEISERNFTLSAFGLPEFNQAITPRPTNSKTPWWIFGFSAIALGVAIIARRVGSRSKAVGFN